MKQALHWLGVALESAHLVLAVTLVFIPEARSPAALEALRGFMWINGVRMMWMLYVAGAFGMTHAQLVRAERRPPVSLVLASAMVMSVWARMVS